MTAELACAYASLILHDDNVEITGEKISALIHAAGIKDVEPIWPTLFAKALKGVNVANYLTNVGSGGGSVQQVAQPVVAQQKKEEPKKEEPKKEEKKEDTDEDMGFGLFD